MPAPGADDSRIGDAEEAPAVPALPAAGVPSLRAFQEVFLAGLRGEPAPQAGLFLEPPRGTTGDRWHVYREAYVLRLVEAVGNDHPATARILGAEVFGALVRRYLAAHPPASHDIGRAADALPGYLEGDPLTESLPFLPDLARFEHALAAAVVAADPDPPSRQDLAALDPDLLFEGAPAPAPGAVYLESEWPLGDLWETRDKPDDEIALEVVGRPSRIVVFRQGLAVRWRHVEDDDEAALLAGAARGATLAGLLDSGVLGAPEDAVPRLVPRFLALIESSILRVPILTAPFGASTSSE